MIKKITSDELINIRRTKEHLTVVDVIGIGSYEKKNIPGAIEIPLEELEEKADKLLNKNDTIFLFCNSVRCTASSLAAEMLERLGFKHILDYRGRPELL